MKTKNPQILCAIVKKAIRRRKIKSDRSICILFRYKFAAAIIYAFALNDVCPKLFLNTLGFIVFSLVFNVVGKSFFSGGTAPCKGVHPGQSCHHSYFYRQAAMAARVLVIRQAYEAYQLMSQGDRRGGSAPQIVAI